MTGKVFSVDLGPPSVLNKELLLFLLVRDHRTIFVGTSSPSCRPPPAAGHNLGDARLVKFS